MWKFSLSSSQSDCICFVFFMLVCRTPLPVPGNFFSSSSSFNHNLPFDQHKKPEKAIDNHATTFFAADWDPSEPIIVLLVLSLAASFVSGLLLLGKHGRGGSRPASVCLPTCPPLPDPWLCLAVLALKGRRHTIGFTRSSVHSIKQKSAHFIQHYVHTAAVRWERDLRFVCGRLKTASKSSYQTSV